MVTHVDKLGDVEQVETESIPWLQGVAINGYGFNR